MQCICIVYQQRHWSEGRGKYSSGVVQKVSDQFSKHTGTCKKLLKKQKQKSYLASNYTIV